MRRKLWIGMIGLLGLLMGVLPASVLATFFQAECGMSCCEPKAAATSCCNAPDEVAIAPSSSGDSCPCSIAPAPTPDHDAAVSLVVQPLTVAMLPEVPTFEVVTSNISSCGLPTCGIRGPPVAGVRSCPLLRAPPVS